MAFPYFTFNDLGFQAYWIYRRKNGRTLFVRTNWRLFGASWRFEDKYIVFFDQNGDQTGKYLFINSEQDRRGGNRWNPNVSEVAEDIANREYRGEFPFVPLP